MKFIKKFFEDKVRVGVLVVCLLILSVVGFSLVTKYTLALDTSYHTGIKNLKYYNQGNYASVKYCLGSKTVATSGCGATSLAVIASSFTSSKYTPKYVANWICDHGHRDNGKGGGGTPWYYFTMDEMLDEFELEVETLFKKKGLVGKDAGQTYDSTEGNAILNAVKQGKGIVLHIPGHYVAVGPNEKCSSNEVYYYNVGRSYENGCYTPKALFKKTYNYKNRCSNEGNCGWKAAFAYNSKGESNIKVRVYFNANGAKLGNDTYYLGSTNNILKASNGNRYYKEYEYTDESIDLPNYGGTTFKMSYKGYKNASPFWNTKKDGSGTKIYQTAGKHDAKYLFSAAGCSLDEDCSITLYGQWKPIEYKIYYVGNGNTGENYTTGHCTSSNKCGLDVYTSGTTYENDIFKHATLQKYDTEVTLRKNRFVKDGYTFVGWATSETGSVKYTNQDVVKNLSSTDGDIIYLYAKWKANTYKIEYNGNGSDGGSTESSTHTYGKSKSLTTNGYTRTNYTFNGWNTEKDGSGVKYKNGQSVKNLTTDSADTFVLYAQWKAEDDTNSDDSLGENITYSVEYNSNGGSGTMESSSYIYNIAGDLATNSYVKEGYVFDGWNTEKDGTGISYVDEQTISNLSSTEEASITLYAQWIKEEDVEIDKVVDDEEKIDDGSENEVEDDFDEEIGDAEEEPGDVKDDSTISDDNIDESPQTGSLAIILVSLIGLGSLIYFVYYCKKLKI